MIVADTALSSGVRVLDFGLLTAGANTSAMLADLGADVIKIESGAYLDPFRVVGKMDNDDGWWNRSPQFRFTNRNKRGLALNLKDARRPARDPRARGTLRRRGRELPPRRARSRGPGLQADLKAINPRLVFAAISSQGDTGPERMNVSFGSTLDATSGIASLTGYEGEEPRISGMDVNYPDQIVSLFATGIVITAVMEARRTRQGLRSSISPSARSRPSPWARRSWPPRPIRRAALGPRGNTRGRRGAAGRLSLPRRTLDRRHPGGSRPGARGVLRRRTTATTPWRRCWPRHRRRALQRRRRPAARHQRWPASPWCATSAAGW